MFVVFDLDGTLACAKHRHHFIERSDLDSGEPGEVDWDSFFRACVNDAPIWPIINTLIAFKAAGARVEIWTGRSFLVVQETEDWLRRHNIGFVPMKMRPHGHHGPDVELKRSWLRAHDARPDLVFEDRDRVVAMWREEGIQCCHVAPGDF